MTFEEKIKGLLVANGMFDHMADDVMERVKADEVCVSMQGRLSHNVDDYPPQLFPVMWEIAKFHALEYIDENLPQAWFRPMFAN